VLKLQKPLIVVLVLVLYWVRDGSIWVNATNLSPFCTVAVDHAVAVDHTVAVHHTVAVRHTVAVHHTVAVDHTVAIILQERWFCFELAV